jgi:hypothetical protein
MVPADKYEGRHAKKNLWENNGWPLILSNVVLALRTGLKQWLTNQ